MTLPKGEGSVDPQGENFGAHVRRLREEREIGLRPFAKMIKVSATYLSKIERGELPPPAEERIKEIARLLEQNPDELLALAGKVASDVREIIKEQPRAMASFLRTARGLGPEELRRLEEEVQKHKSGT
jgi:transcriptional regulator with XRE-family HTH domain